MNWKSFIFGVGVGIFSGIMARELVTSSTFISSESVLEQVKNAFRKQGSINGSWIYSKTEPYEKNHITYSVYKGGISRMVNGDLEQYEFIADAKTGIILDAFPLNNSH